MAHRWNDADREKHAEKKLSQCYFVHHKYHMDALKLNQVLSGARPSDYEQEPRHSLKKCMTT